MNRIRFYEPDLSETVGKILAIVFIFTIYSTGASAQNVTGQWITIDDETGEKRSIVKIYEEAGEIFGKIMEILDDEGDEKVLCDQCRDHRKDQPVLGMVIIEGLTLNGDRYDGGTILDPENGNKYRCYIELEDENTLKVRGYRGISLLGRTQLWHRPDE